MIEIHLIGIIIGMLIAGFIFDYDNVMKIINNVIKIIKSFKKEKRK